MIKFALFSINIICFILMNLFSDTDILVENNTPDILYPGEKKEVRITVNKSEIQGFAKLELVIPSGLKVSAGETQGASFTFSEQKARFVWMTLPNENTFSITYYLESMENAEGAFNVNGSFSYILENKRIDYIVPVRKVTISKEIPVAQQTEQTATTTETVSAAKPVQTNPETKALTETTPSVQSNASPPAEKPVTTISPSMVASSIDTIICTRSVTKLSDTDFRIDLTVKNNSIKGFAKILETLPPNCKADKIDDAGAVVTQEKNSIKFVWFEIPNTSSVVVSYKISCLNPFSSTPQIIGKLSFVENNNPRELPVIFIGQNEAVLAENKPKNESPVESPKEETVKNNPPVETPKEIRKEEIAENNPPKESPRTEKSSVSNKTEKTEGPVASVPSAETGVTYKVQILAAHRVVNKTYFTQKHSFSEQFNIENHEGWVKYTTGKFDEYKKARNERERLRENYESLPGPFVTAYNDGERITVQEALLISKQQWIQ